MPTTLIFGASRGLGRAFTHCALSQGHRVVALVRNPEMAAELRTLGVEVVEGDAHNAYQGGKSRGHNNLRYIKCYIALWMLRLMGIQGLML